MWTISVNGGLMWMHQGVNGEVVTKNEETIWGLYIMYSWSGYITQSAGGEYNKQNSGLDHGNAWNRKNTRAAHPYLHNDHVIDFLTQKKPRAPERAF